jgi:hypothetical protein
VQAAILRWRLGLGGRAARRWQLLLHGVPIGRP